VRKRGTTYTNNRLDSRFHGNDVKREFVIFLPLHQAMRLQSNMSKISHLRRFAFLASILLLLPIFLCTLLIQSADAASVTLAWDPNTEPDIAGYKLCYGTVKGAYEFAIDVGNQTTYTISGFVEGVDYYFVVTAYNAYGLESDFSDEVSYPGPPFVTIALSTGLNLISLPLESFNPSISALTEQLSPCLFQVLAYTRDAEGYDTWLYYDPSLPEQSTLSTMDAGKGYWVDMACPGEMTIVGNRTTNPITLVPGLNLVGYNSLTPLAVSQALSSIAGKYTMVWAYEDDEWLFFDPSAETESTLKTLSPGSGYWIEAIEETTWTLPSVMTISLSAGLNLISLPLQPLNSSISALTEQLSPCLFQVLAYTRDAEGYDTWLYYDPTLPEQNTLSTMEPGKGYWVEMACPAEMTVVGNPTTNPIALVPGLNLVGYNSLTPLPVSQALSSIANQYSMIWAYRNDEWLFYDPNDETASTLQVFTPGTGYWIEAKEETTWTLP
jgi:hypothetical protein